MNQIIKTKSHYSTNIKRLSSSITYSIRHLQRSTITPLARYKYAFKIINKRMAKLFGWKQANATIITDMICLSTNSQEIRTHSAIIK